MGRRLLHRRLFALDRFAALMRAGRVPGSLRIPGPWRSQWPLLIRTIDAMALDPRPRPVAVALFGETRVKSEWTAESDRLRMQVRRLLIKARGLLRGRYLDIIR
ncbi:DNA -binding domain-containing protein [Sphingobium limneticum]